MAFEGRTETPFAALAAAMRALKEHGESYESLIALARVETGLDWLQRAAQTWRRALSHGNGPEVWAGLGTVLIRHGQQAAGMDVLRHGVHLYPDDVALLSSLAMACLYNGDDLGASRFASRALQRDPQCHDARLCRARANFAIGNSTVAEADLVAVERSGFKPQEARLLRIGQLSRVGEHETALFLAAELCEAFPASSECLRMFRSTFIAFRAKADDTALRDFLGGLEIPWFPPMVPLDRAIQPQDGVRVDVIIPVHNALSSVLACLESVQTHSGQRLGRVILIDDASEGTTRDELAAQAKQHGHMLIRNAQRLGFTGAVQRGIAHSNAAVFVVLNSDTLVEAGWLDELYAGLVSGPKIAMTGPMSNNATWQNIGPVFDGSYTFVKSALPSPIDRGRNAELCRSGHFNSVVPMPILHGFCVMLDRAAYDTVGGFDCNTYPEGYGETQDLSLRLTRAGYTLGLVTDCIVYHERGASTSVERREALGLAARQTLYEKYSALNYLCLEMVCCTDQFIATVRDKYTT